MADNTQRPTSPAGGHYRVCFAIPDHMLEAVANSPLADPEARQAAQATLIATQEEREKRLAIEEHLRSTTNPPSGNEPQEGPSGGGGEGPGPSPDQAPGPSSGDAPGPSSGGAPGPSPGDAQGTPPGDAPGPPSSDASESHPGGDTSGGQSILASQSPEPDFQLAASPQIPEAAQGAQSQSGSVQETASHQESREDTAQGLMAQEPGQPTATGDKDKTSDAGEIASTLATATPAPLQIGRSATMRRYIFDEHQTKDKPPGDFVRTEEGPETQDPSAVQAFDGLRIAYQFYKEVFGQNSLDFQGMALVGSVHWGQKISNAVWNGRQMRFGEGDGIYWLDFTSALDVIGHELTHGVVGNSCKLVYKNQSGALNEHLADAFGTMIKQWHLKQDVAKASWLLGAELFSSKVKGTGGNPAALRSMKAPGTAYNDPVLGKDSSRAHMKDLYVGEWDKGGVHVNSGIPNKAFYLVATAMGGYSWQTVGPFWYHVMTQSGLKSDATIQDFANSLMTAANTFGSSKLQRAMRQAWADVGVTV